MMYVSANQKAVSLNLHRYGEGAVAAAVGQHVAAWCSLAVRKGEGAPRSQHAEYTFKPLLTLLRFHDTHTLLLTTKTWATQHYKQLKR
jgi:hypothetical protein